MELKPSLMVFAEAIRRRPRTGQRCGADRVN
jgi:hypothetical protein